jgi:eukaryotic-like serine/threonine-protein kinase
MDASERWDRVSAILSEALDLPQADRDAFVAGQIERYPALRTEVLGVWDEMSRTGSVLDRPPAAGPPDQAALGPYRIVGELGEGGMGVVHLAERSDGQFTRKVAIKRVGSARPTFDALRRFREEREILARLDHANITRLLDSGLDPSGVPYLVMEHVEGLPLTAYCRQHALTASQRLELFLKVCAGVQHAHQHLVIHRDIKPANILVAGTGEPKLLDFGIAKALGDSAPQDVTRTAHPALTLDYASPEQVRGQMVTTASDVYSLGVLLYELLADRKAYHLGEHSLADGVRLVCELTPVPPSQVAPAERRAELRGDLDAIVAKAMEKAPLDRYASVADLAADVTAHLGHQPVRARRASFAYVARKFVRRHRAGTAMAAAGLLLVGAGVGAVLWQARVAERERVRAQRRFDEVRQLAHYVIFDLHDGVAKLPGATELRRQMIERSLAYLDSLASEAAGDPRLQLELAEAYSRLGDVLGRRDVANLGDRAGALASFGKARDQLRHAVAARPHDAAAQRALAGVLIKLHGAVDVTEEKQALLDESMGIWERLAQGDASEDNLYGLASAHFAAHIGANGGPSAIPHMERSLVIFQQLLAARPQDTVRQRNVALCHKYLGGSVVQLDPQRAVVHMQEAARLDGARLAAEPRNPQAKLDYTFDLSAIAFFHFIRREYAQALPMYEETLRLRREILAGDPADVQARERLADTLMRIGGLHALAGRHGVARGFLQESLGLLRGQPEDQKTIALTLSCLYLLMAEVTYVEKGDACAWYRRLPAQVERVRKVGLDPRFDGPFASIMERAADRIESCAAQPASPG